jgi:L-alanine-DL-glutamate epimerase-like enolase superfamily enzyme
MTSLRSATIYSLHIPFVEAFNHRAAERRTSDSVVVRVVDDDGVVGFGEGTPRAYVTGETSAFMADHLATDLVPSVLGRELPRLTAPDDLAQIDALIKGGSTAGVRSDNASRAALELALIDCALRRWHSAAADVLGVRGRNVVYSGVISAGSLDAARAHARQMKLIGLRQVKVKVGYDDDVRRIAAIREVLGGDASIRIDANGAWTLDQAIAMLDSLTPHAIAAVEEPLRSSTVDELIRLREATSIPVVVDESIVSTDDADALLAGRAVDLLNIRVSKCGGLSRSLLLARRAIEAGVGVQIGAHVGETAILSAAGRLLAASVPESAFVEGSFGTLLLVEDISIEPVRFGRAGAARVLGGPGLGVAVHEDRLRALSCAVRDVQPKRTGR